MYTFNNGNIVLFMNACLPGGILSFTSGYDIMPPENNIKSPQDILLAERSSSNVCTDVPPNNITYKP